MMAAYPTYPTYDDMAELTQALVDRERGGGVRFSGHPAGGRVRP